MGAGGGELMLVEKHSRAVRWMHWINFPVLTILIWSGLLIYWGDSIPPYQHAHQVYRIGVGNWTLVRLFPDWFWKMLHAPYQLTTGADSRQVDSRQVGQGRRRPFTVYCLRSELLCRRPVSRILF